MAAPAPPWSPATPSARPPAARGRRRWPARLAIAAAAAMAGLLCLLRPPPVVDLVELKILDWHALVRGPLRPPEGITVVAIDEDSLRRIGRWPWPRTVTATLVTRLAEGGARLVALDVLQTEPDQNSSLALAHALAEAYRAQGLDRGRGVPFARVLDQARAEADTDAALAAALAATRQVVLPYFFLFPPADAPPLGDEALRLLHRSRVVAFATPEAEHALEPRRAAGVLLPLAPFHAAARGAGHVNRLPDTDGAVRRSELVLRLGDGHYPSLALETARLALGLPRSRLRLTATQVVLLGDRAIPTDEDGRMLLAYYGGTGTFRHLSAAAVVAAPAAPPVRDHVVLVGFTAQGLMDTIATPFDPVLPGVEMHATALANMLEGRGLRRLGSLVPLEAAAILLLAAGGPLLLPRLGPLPGSAAAVVAAVGLAATAHLAYRTGTWVMLLPPLLTLVTGHVGGVTLQLLTEERERRRIKQAFRQYVPPAVVEQIGRDPGALAFGGQRRVLTVLFSDIRDFTTFSERRSPEEVVAALREYLTAMVDVVFRHRGTLDKFIGDAIMAFFGAPFDNPDHAFQACQAAVEMSEAVERLNARWEAEGREPFVTGFGLATGEMLVGNFGSEQRFTYTVIGDQVNLGARLESLNKDYPSRRHIILSDATHAMVRERVIARPLGSVTVKGRVRPVEIYELVDIRRPPGEGAP